MAMQDIGGVIGWPRFPSGSTFAFGALTIDAASEVAAICFRPRFTKTCTHIHFRTGTVTTGATVDVRLETVDGSGQPSGSLYGTNTNGSQVIADANDNVWFRTALTASASVVAGTPAAIVVVGPVSPGNLNLASITADGMPSHGWPTPIAPTRATEQDQSAQLVCALEYSDGTFEVPAGGLPYNTVSSVSLDTATNPDEVALIFTPQVKMRVVGWYGSIFTEAAGADFRVSLYESGNNTPLLTKDVDGDFNTTNVNSRGFEDYFNSGQIVLPTKNYFLGVLPTTANNITIRYFEVDSTYLGLLDTMPGKRAMHWSQRNRSGTSDPDSAAWSNTTNRRAFLGLLIDQFDDGVSSSSAGGMGARPRPFAPGISR